MGVCVSAPRLSKKGDKPPTDAPIEHKHFTYEELSSSLSLSDSEAKTLFVNISLFVIGKVCFYIFNFRVVP